MHDKTTWRTSPRRLLSWFPGEQGRRNKSSAPHCSAVANSRTDAPPARKSPSPGPWSEGERCANTRAAGPAGAPGQCTSTAPPLEEQVGHCPQQKAPKAQRTQHKRRVTIQIWADSHGYVRGGPTAVHGTRAAHLPREGVPPIASSYKTSLYFPRASCTQCQTNKDLPQPEGPVRRSTGAEPLMNCCRASSAD